MKYILPLFICLLSFMSCTKDSEFSVPEEIVKAPVKNAYRAVKISGTNIHWGDFTLSLEYGKEELHQGFLTNTKNDTVGVIRLNRGKGYIQYYIQDYVVNADQDSINRIKFKLDSLHGAGTYNLWDSIPKRSRTIQEAVIYPYSDGRIKKIITKRYRPHENIHATGEDFNNSYILVSTHTHIYEYNSDNNVCVDRMIKDIHNPEDKDLFTRTIYKNEIEYDGDRILSMISFIVHSGENYSELGKYVYAYDSGRLTSVDGNGETMTFTYAGNNVTLTENGRTTKMELDEHGNVVKYSDMEGNTYSIEYEEGHGNLSIFAPLEDRMKNPYHIK